MSGYQGFHRGMERWIGRTQDFFFFNTIRVYLMYYNGGHISLCICQNP